jgi:hypothetical protein
MLTVARHRTALMASMAIAVVLFGPVESAAQLNGQNVKGDTGLKSGSQAEDRFDTRLPSVLIRGKNRVWGLGPEVSLAVAANKTIYAFVTVRYQWEIGARTTTEGAAWNILATFPIGPIRLP